MTVVVFEEDVLRLICRYAVQGGRSLEENQSFYDELKGEWVMHSVVGLVMCLGDFNGHVCRHINGFHETYGVGQKNLEGRMLFKFCLVKEICMSYTLFKRQKFNQSCLLQVK